ncbi:hypothetical protein ACA910_018827 [Epithemia clementina (nom. ined.)]
MSTATAHKKNEDARSSFSVLQAKRKELQHLVQQVVQEKALTETNFAGLLALGNGLKEGHDTLNVQSIPGSETNFAYNVSLAKDPTKAVFVKISFEFPAWNPELTQTDLARAANEFQILPIIADTLFGGTFDQAPLPRPYYLLDLPSSFQQGNGGNEEEEDARFQKGKISIFEWSSSMDVQWALQFVTGNVDQRVLVDVAETLAKLNVLVPVQDDWNEDCHQNVRAVLPLVKQFFDQFVNVPESQTDACIDYCKELGLERLELLVDKLDEEFRDCREVFCHGDCKQSNILVMKADQETGNFNDEGKWMLVDWEMSIKGRSGRDPGVVQALTIASAYCFAAQGNRHAAHHLQDCVMEFWNAYEQTLRSKGRKDDAYILDALKGSFGGTMMYATLGYYMLGLEKELLPLQGVDEETRTRALGSLGKTGLQLGEIAYLDKFSQLTLNQMKMFVAILIDGEIDSLLHFSENRQQGDFAAEKKPRRATLVVQHILAAGQRRSSSTDKELVELAKRRLSESGKSGGARASVYDASSPALLPPEVLKELDIEDD